MTTPRTTLLRGGHIYAPAFPGATAMLTRGDRIVYVGSDTGATRLSADETIDLAGALVTPAFVDAHVHTTSTGLALTGLNVAACGSLADALAAVEAHARASRGGAVLGHGWDETRWPERRPPTRAELDRASYGGVVYLSRVDVHSAVVSSALLAAAPEIRSEPGFDDSGHVTRDAHHVARQIARAALSPSQRESAQRAALHRARELGIAAIHELAGPDISSEADLRGLIELAATDPEAPEVIPYWAELGGIERAHELGAIGAAGDLFVDGAIGSHTACLRTVYADADGSGFAYLSAADVRDHVAACTEAGLQAGFHAIGDGAMEIVVRGLEEATDRVGVDAVRRARHRIEHAEMIEPWMIESMAKRGVIASVQPAFDRLWGGTNGMYAQRLGVERALSLNPFAAMSRAGVVLALGSDSPVTPLDPWGTVRAAAFHHVAEHQIAVEVAFQAHTRSAWLAARREGDGVLAPGAPATYAIWDGVEPAANGLPALEPDGDLPACRRTVRQGRILYDRGGPPPGHDGGTR